MQCKLLSFPSHSNFTYTGITKPPGPLETGGSNCVFEPNEGLLLKGDLDLGFSLSFDFSVTRAFLLSGLKFFDFMTGDSCSDSGSDNSVTSLEIFVISLKIKPLFIDK